MRPFAALIVLGTCWCAAGCATAVQGIALLATLRNGQSQPTFSEFASQGRNYSAEAPEPATATCDGTWTSDDGSGGSDNDAGELPTSEFRAGSTGECSRPTRP
jgi:hypothetical protein